MPASYPLDTTGFSIGNKIPDEVHVLTEINDTTYRIIVPDFAPFYLDNFAVNHVDSLGNITPLSPDIDFYLCLPFVGATRSIGKIVYGGITINTLLTDGVIKVTYQCLGGMWSADAGYVMERLAEIMYNPKLTVWDAITNVQETFPPINHSLDIDDTYGQEQLIDAVNALAAAVLAGPSQAVGIVKHLTDFDNPHRTTKDQIELGNVDNIRSATDEEVTSRLEVDAYPTLKQLIQHPLQADVDLSTINQRLDNLDTEMGVANDTNDAQDQHLNALDQSIQSLSQASADQGQAISDQGQTLSQHAQSLLSISQALQGHIQNTNDPHQVTKEQVDLGNVSNLSVATPQEVADKASVDKYVLLSQVLTLLGSTPSTPAVTPFMSASSYYLMG